MKILLICLVAFFGMGCSAPGDSVFKKSASGLQFKIIGGGCECPVAGSGATVKMHYTWYRGDTIWQSSRNNKPYYQQLIPGLIFPYHPFESLVYGVRKDDSVVVMLRVDSLLRHQMLDSLPPHTSINDVWTVGIKVLNVFPFDPLKGDSIIRADMSKEEQMSLHKK